MDIFYYWKDVDADLKAGRIGYFKSGAEQLKELAESHPDLIWVFKTPRGQKGQVQLLARLRFADHAKPGFKGVKELSYLHYHPADRFSVWFTQSDQPAAVAAATDWVQRHFPRIIASNFQGANGQAALRGLPLQELGTLTRSWPSEPFSARVEPVVPTP